MKKYYDIIGLKEGCKKEEVEKQYKQLSKELQEMEGNYYRNYKVQEAYKIIMLSIQKEDQNNKKTERHSDALEEIRKLREEVQSKNLEIGDLKEIKKENIVKELPNATGTLVLGILAVVFMWCYGIPGIILGIIALSISSKDKNLLEENPDGYSNSGNHKAGRICAKIGIYVPLCLFIIFFLIYQNQ